MFVNIRARASIFIFITSEVSFDLLFSLSLGQPAAAAVDYRRNVFVVVD
jgi:hypothetical protein